MSPTRYLPVISGSRLVEPSALIVLAATSATVVTPPPTGAAMNFLVDAQLPRRMTAWLTAAGADAVHTLDLPDGNRTTDDMSRHWLTYYTMSDEEFKAENVERAALRKVTSSPQ